jgi:hypothetical protein
VRWSTRPLELRRRWAWLHIRPSNLYPPPQFRYRFSRKRDAVPLLIARWRNQPLRSEPMTTCSGGLVVHLDGSVAACTNDDDVDGGGCVDRAARHLGEPKRGVDAWATAITAARTETRRSSVSGPRSV